MAFLDNVLLFGRLLHDAGLDVHTGRVLDAIRGLDAVGIRSRAEVRATLRALLVHRREDMPTFDRAFELFFRDHRAPAPGPALFSLGERPRVVARPVPGTALRVTLEDEDSRPTAPPPSRAAGAWSPAGLSRTKDFAEFSDAELERARELLERLPWRLGTRRTRRWGRADGGEVDLRPMLRRSVTRGDLVDLPRRERRVAARPVVLLADVSGSMERYSRLLLHFVYGLAHSGARVESFVFATRLTRLTRSVASRRGGAALARLARDVHDWGGGTRIGESLRTFNTQWARRVVRNGPVVIIVSDGWDRGDPRLLSRELARIRRSCRRLIWLNPLLGHAGYEPLTRGMQAALSRVDDFLPAHNIASLEQLARHLGALPARTLPAGHARGGRPIPR
ncbi:MAG TPA: VWA domain-containing protein [Vicinamibacterales bacterium]|nr:VWA domain-containing protein [Vicinamibacterales bacterium]